MEEFEALGVPVGSRVFEIGIDFSELVRRDLPVLEILGHISLLERVILGESAVFATADASIVEKRAETRTVTEGVAPTTMGATQVLDGELAVLPCLVEAIVEQEVVLRQVGDFIFGDDPVFEESLEKLAVLPELRLQLSGLLLRSLEDCVGLVLGESVIADEIVEDLLEEAHDSWEWHFGPGLLGPFLGNCGVWRRDRRSDEGGSHDDPPGDDGGHDLVTHSSSFLAAMSGSLRASC